MSTKCSCDSDKEPIWFCYPCEKLICECCQREHGTHLFEESSSLQRQLTARLPSIVQLVVDSLPDLHKQMDQVCTRGEEMEKRMNTLKGQLDSRYEIIQAKLKAHHDKMCQEADQYLVKIKSQGDQERDVVQKKIATIADIAERCQKDGAMGIIESLKTEDLCTRILDDIRNYSSIASVFHAQIPEISFSVEDEDLEKELGQLYGDLRCGAGESQHKPTCNEPLQQKSSKGNVTPKPAFPALPVRAGQKVSAIVQTSSNDVIIGYSTNKVIHYFDRNAKKQKSRELPFYVQNMSATSSGAVIASENKGSKVMKIESNKVELLFDASPFTTFGVLFSKFDSVIFVCCQTDETGLIYVITSDGKLKEVITKSTEGHVLFQKPHRIAEHPSCNILYVTDPGQKMLIAIDKHRQRLFQYNGGLESRNFIPIDVAFCPSTNTMLVTNWKGNSVHQLTEDGHFRSLIVSQRDNILYPTALLVDCLKRIWISHKDRITVLKCSFK